MNYKRNPEICLSCKTRDEHLFRYLFEAILNVHRNYITYEIHAPYDGSKEHLERVFAYELYHQWSKQLEANGIQDLVLNGEVYKHLKWETICYNCDNEPVTKGVYPDLVLHSSQGKGDNQKIICEIKRESNISKEALFADFLKLSCYLSADSFPKNIVPFEFGIFILAGEFAELKEIKIGDGTTIKWAEDSFTFGQYKEKFQQTFSRIICIAYDGNGTSLEYDTLDNIINKQN